MTIPRILATLLLVSGFTMTSVSCDETEEEALFPTRTVEEWEVVWADEFDGAAGEAPDAAKWTFDIGRGNDGWGNNELQYYTDSDQNVAQNGDGQLAITAREEATNGADYSSARIKTQGLFGVTYGRIEARIQLPIGAGLWPAFWMLGADITSVGWPQSGEIDIMENRGQTTDTTSGALHGPGYSGGSPIAGTFFLAEGEAFNDDFHVFSVEWSPGRIAWKVDGVVFHVATPGSVPGPGTWVFDDDFFIILNMAVGGTFVGPPNDTTPFPQQMLIDYVRVSQRVQ